MFPNTQAESAAPHPFVVNDNCTVGDAHALLDSIPSVCGSMATESPAPRLQARGAGSATEPATSHSCTWALRRDGSRRRWRDMTDDSETDEDAVVRSVALGPTAAARAVDANAVAEAAAAGARVCTAIPRVVRICECAPGIFVNEVGERCDRCLITVKFSVAQVSIVSFNLNCMPS